jgi:histone H3/H4
MGLVVKSQIKEIVDAVVKDTKVSSDLAPALDEKVKEILTTAVKRAEANGRRTVMAKDL